MSHVAAGGFKKNTQVTIVRAGPAPRLGNGFRLACDAAKPSAPGAPYPVLASGQPPVVHAVIALIAATQSGPIGNFKPQNLVLRK